MANRASGAGGGGWRRSFGGLLCCGCGRAGGVEAEEGAGGGEVAEHFAAGGSGVGFGCDEIVGGIFVGTLCCSLIALRSLESVRKDFNIAGDGAVSKDSSNIAGESGRAPQKQLQVTSTPASRSG